jgi:hypothetical protein
MKIAIIGAQGTGKTQLAFELNQHWRNQPDEIGVKPPTLSDGAPLLLAICTDEQKLDPAHYHAVLLQHHHYDLTLLTGLDLLTPHGHFDAEVHAPREALDARLRAALTQGQLAYAVVYGQGSMRLQAALNAITAKRSTQAQPMARDTPRWQWACDKCSDPACEQHLFTSMFNQDK